MARPKLGDKEVGYLDSLWRELKVLEADYGAITTILAQPAPRPGVFTFRLEFTPVSEKASETVGRNAVVVAFPNESTQTLAGSLWSASMKLTKQVSDVYHEVKSRGLLL